MQREVFESEKVKSTSTGLIISKQQKNILSKQQQTFNKLVKKIEKLRLDLQQLNKSLNEKLDFYAKDIYPLEKQLNELNKEEIKLLYQYFKDKKLLPVKLRKTLGEVIAGLLNENFSFEKGEPEDELKEIFKAVQGISYEEAVEEEFMSMKSGLESMFEEHGFDMNFDDMHSTMTQEEIMKKAVEMQEEFKQQAREKDEKRATRKKTKKQLEKEEKERQIEEARNKNITSIYKQLAKVFHPDLEPDEEKKLEKGELMKQLTVAYENNDLHTLLSLELAWIQKEDNNPGNLADDKLGIYNEVLKEQVFELEEEIDQVLHHPRYEPLQKFAIFSNHIESINLIKEKQQAESLKDALALSIQTLKTNEKLALAAVKELIRNHEIEKKFTNRVSSFWA